MQSGTGNRDDVAQLVHVGRQPLYDRQDEIVGYELLFRADATATEASRHGTEATSRVIVNAFTEFGMAQLVGERLGFVNLTADFLVGTCALPFEPGQTVLEILETVQVDARVLAGVEALAGQGYPIALDDFVWGQGHESLLPLASYAKLEVAGVDRDQVRATVAACRQFPGLQLVAERLETEADLRFARELGFDLFQGYVLGPPQVLSAAALSPSRMRRFALMGYLSRPDIDLDRIVSTVALDPALTYRMLRATNSVAASLNRRVSSLREAMVLLGTDRLRQWLSLMLISDLGELGEHHLVTTMVRARLCQVLAARAGLDGDTAFTVGLLAGIGELLSTPLDELLGQLPLTDEVTRPLVDGTGRLGAVLGTVSAYERGDLDALRRTDVCPEELSHDYLGAVEWAQRTYRDVVH